MRTVIMIATIGALGGCTLGDLNLGGRSAVFNAGSVDEVVALGGTRMTGDEITAAFTGATLVEPNEAWTWSINEDGTHQAQSDDPDWADDPASTWYVANDQFCRENEDLALWCSDVYRVGNFYRFTERDGSLALWTVTPV